MQTEIDFTRPITRRENNKSSQAILEVNESYFRGQCKLVMDALLRGEKLTTASALTQYRIGDLRRRIKDLKDNYRVIGIESDYVNGRFKCWWLNKNWNIERAAGSGAP